MPALIHFNRKWLIASDDFVIPCAIEAVLRSVWLIATVAITWVEIFGCSDDTLFIYYYYYTFTGQFAVTICLCIGLFITSSRGSTLQTHKRIHLPKILYMKCATVLIDLALLSFGSWILSQELHICSQWKIFIEAATVCLFLYVLSVIIGIFICFNSLGSSFYWDNKNRVNSAQIKKAEKIWRFRLKFFCCCADVSEDENDFVYVEISTFLHTFSNDIDLAPTDILAGLLLVCKKHAIEKRRVKQPSTSDRHLVDNPNPSWMTAENALYYFKLAKSAYVWVTFCNPLYPWKLCNLISPSRCCSGVVHQQATPEQDGPFYCDSSGIKKIRGFSDSDVLYTSFSNSIYEPAFIIAFDHAKKVVIIAIRGTYSFSDMVTDMDGDEMDFPGEIFPDKIKCHRGTLRSALFIHKKINELQVLKSAFSEKPSYNLVITGHSLGASIASILSLLLYQEYPSLQCYSYGPLAVLSANGIEKTFDLVFSVVVGDDMAPRLSVHSSKELIKQICSSLEESQIPKYKLLTRAFWHYVKKTLKLPHKVLNTSEVYVNEQVEIKDETPVKEVQIDIMPNKTQLYAPGRILYLNGSTRFEYSWTTGISFQSLIISPYVIKDHQPHQIQFFLEKFKSDVESTILPLEKRSGETEDMRVVAS